MLFQSIFYLFLIVLYHISLFLAHPFLVLPFIYCMLCYSLYILLYDFMCFMVIYFSISFRIYAFLCCANHYTLFHIISYDLYNMFTPLFSQLLSSSSFLLYLAIMIYYNIVATCSYSFIQYSTAFVLWMMCLHLFRKFIWCRLFNITLDVILLWLNPPRERAMGNRGVDAVRFLWSIWKYLEVSECCRKLRAVKACGHNLVILGGIYRTFEQPSCEAWGKAPISFTLQSWGIVAMDSPCREGWEKLSQVEPQQWWQVRQDNSQLSDTFALVQSPIAGALCAGMLAGIDHDVQAWSLAVGSNTCLYVVDRNDVVLLSILVKYGSMV